jgi:K+-sensing histidine kinase KdpD
VNTTTQQATARAAIFVGPVLAVAVAWATDTVEGEMSIANAALALAFVCVAAALANPLAGFITSAVAALALNYFHTAPVHSLRMTEPDEIVTVVLLVLLGASVSIATTLRVRARVATHRSGTSTAASQGLRSLLAEGGALPLVWQTAVQAACRQAGSVDVSLFATVPEGLPLISQKQSSGAAGEGDVVVIPETGAVLQLPHGQGALLLKPQSGLGAITATRAMLVQFGDQLAATLSAGDEQRSAA